MASSTLVDYSDLDFSPVFTDQYRANLYYQIRNPDLPEDLSIEELESIIDGRPRLPSKMKGVIKPTDLEPLPDDIQWLIWRTYFSTFVNKDIISSQKFHWSNPSQKLITLCRDEGCIQQGHSELEDMIEDENMWAWQSCTEGICLNCKHEGFPCTNLAWYGFQNDFIEGLWQPNFVEE